MEKRLTIREANRLARGRARVSVDPVDRQLWQVEGDGWVEAHEPMTRLAWQTFLAEKVDAKADEPAGIDEQDLFDALKDNLSPQAVAAIVAYLQPAKTKSPAVDREVRWFADQLTVLVGGPEQQNRLAEEVGL